MIMVQHTACSFAEKENKKRDTTNSISFSVFFISPDKYINRCSCELPVFTDFVFQEAFVRFFDPLGKVTEEDKRRDLACGKLGDIFDLDIFSFHAGGG